MVSNLQSWPKVLGQSSLTTKTLQAPSPVNVDETLEKQKQP